MDYSERQAQAMLGKHVTYHKESCPLATTDVHENTKNRNWTIINIPTILTKSMTTKSNNLPPQTADLCDAYITSPQRLCIVEPCIF